MNEVKILGMRELYTALSTTIPRNMEAKVLQRALSAGTKLVVQAARRNAVRGGAFPNRRTGTLARAIYAARSKFNQSPTLEVRVVGVRKGKKANKKGRDAWYARLVEYGHRIANKKTGRLESRTKQFKAGTFLSKNTFVHARPFMRPAWDENKDKALTAILAQLKKELDLAITKGKWR